MNIENGKVGSKLWWNLQHKNKENSNIQKEKEKKLNKIYLNIETSSPPVEGMPGFIYFDCILTACFLSIWIISYNYGALYSWRKVIWMDIMARL